MANLKSLLTLLLFSIIIASAGAYTTSIHAPAVLQNENQGSLTVIDLNVTSGSGNVAVNGPSSVDSTTLASAQIAASYAASFLGLNETNYNFNYTIEDRNISVSGPSAGLAFTLLAVAGLQQRQLVPNFTATGTISPSGSVGEIGGVYDKVGAAQQGGMRFIMLPYASNSSFEYLLYYISQQQLGIPVVEVSNISGALPYAFGTASPIPISINLTENYNTAYLPDANISCSNCNSSAFSSLTNYTLNFTDAAVQSMNSKFDDIKAQFASNLNVYRNIENKGYLYSAADFAFLDFINAFMISNTQNFNVTQATNLLDNVSIYCSSLVPPPLTNTNYEFVVGGSLRESWANITITDAQALLQTEQTTDDIIQSINDAGRALAWCRAADGSFGIAASLNGSPIEISPNLKVAVAASISKARNFNTNLYLRSALVAYNSGDYVTAYYASSYANVFGPSSLTQNMTPDQISSMTLQNIGNATDGVWASQFAAQAEFYLHQSQASHGPIAQGYLDQAYSVSLLAKDLSLDNYQINQLSTISNGTVSNMNSGVLQQITSINQNISQIYFLLLLNVALMFVILVVLLVHLLSSRRNPPQRANSRSRSR